MDKNTQDAQREIDALLHRAELWRSYRPVDGALATDHMEIDLDVYDVRAHSDAETESIRLFQPKREEPVRIPRVEYEELREMWREMVRTATMLCTSTVRVIRHMLARLTEIVSTYAHTFEQRTSRPFAFEGGEARVDTSSPPPLRESADAAPLVAPLTIPTVSVRAVAPYGGSMPAGVPGGTKEKDQEVYTHTRFSTDTDKEVEKDDTCSYQPFMRPIARSGREVYARFRASNPEHPAIQTASTPSPTVSEHKRSDDYAVTMPLTDMDDVGETLPLARNDVAISAPTHRTSRPRVWRDAWRIVFSELFGNLTQK